ncbi:MAG TPA: NfeD family protein [Candidatus Solibacter sp.]|nr:NfeD family protein [Candidatus Solibacter sp.]
MTLSNIFLICFLVGFALSLISFLFGTLHLQLPHHLGGHLSGRPGAGHGVFRASAGQGPGPAGGGTGAAAGKGLAGHGEAGISPVNFMTICAFLAWFGGVGYLATQYFALAAVGAVGVAVAGGFAGSSAVFLFMAKVLMPHESHLDPADFEMVGMLATVTLPIRSGGIGEIQFIQEGSRRSCSARSDEGEAVEKGVEVVVARYERGVAYVRRFEEMVK